MSICADEKKNGIRLTRRSKTIQQGLAYAIITICAGTDAAVWKGYE